MNAAYGASDKARLRQRWQIAALQVGTGERQRRIGSTLPREEESEMRQDGADTTAGGAGTHMTRKLATALLAALALFAFQLVHAQTSSAATGLACVQTGLETVASDAADYPPGSTAHFTGTGY